MDDDDHKMNKTFFSKALQGMCVDVRECESKCVHVCECEHVRVRVLACVLMCVHEHECLKEDRPNTTSRLQVL